MAVTKISEEYRKKMSFHAKVEAVRLNLGLSPDFTMTDVIDEGMAYMGIIPESSWTGPQRLQALVEAMGLTFGEPPAACEHAALPAPAAAAASPAAKGAAEPRTVQAGNADASSSWPFRTKRVRGLCAAVEEVEERERKRRCSVEEADELRKEELRAVKQVIVDAIKAENEDKITKLQLQLVRTQKELEEAKANCQDAVENFEDFANEIEEAFAELLCPITYSLPVEPVLAEDGKVYERSAIDDWFKKHRKSPLTNVAMGVRLLPALQIKNLIRAMVSSGALTGDTVDAWKQKLAHEKKMPSAEVAMQERLARLEAEQYELRLGIEARMLSEAQQADAAEQAAADAHQVAALLTTLAAEENQELKLELTVLDQAILLATRPFLEDTITSSLHDPGSRFRISYPGQLSRTVLRKFGFKVPAEGTREPICDAEFDNWMEMEDWQCTIDSRSGSRSDRDPQFELDDAFVFKGGLYVSIREEDEPEKRQPPCAPAHTLQLRLCDTVLLLMHRPTLVAGSSFQMGASSQGHRSPRGAPPSSGRSAAASTRRTLTASSST